MRYKVFWCKVNKYYTDKWLNSSYLKWKDGIFVASCVVTDKAKRKWIRFVKSESKSLEDGEKIYISWCGAFKDGKAQDDFFHLYPELDALKDQIEVLDEDPEQLEKSGAKIISQLTPNPSLYNRGEQKVLSLEKGEDLGVGWKKSIDLSKIEKLRKFNKTQIYTKKFILIQWGCDSFCTFCLTVQKRGRHFYRDKDDILKEILEFEEIGGKEVVLTGVNLSAWGLKNTNQIWESRFAELLQYLLDNSSIARLRISSLWPEFIDDAVLKVFENERIYPHFHYSIQSGSSSTLKAMARHYDWEYMRDLLLRNRAIEREDWVSISIWADIIVWFPGETEEHFQETCDLVRQCKITKIHAFPFSPHEYWENVPAGFFGDQISDEVKKDRMKRLNEIWDEIRANFITSQKWKTLKVLVERVSSTGFKWWTQNYIEVTEKNFEVQSGEIKRNEIITGTLK